MVCALLSARRSCRAADGHEEGGRRKGGEETARGPRQQKIRSDGKFVPPPRVPYARSSVALVVQKKQNDRKIKKANEGRGARPTAHDPKVFNNAVQRRGEPLAGTNLIKVDKNLHARREGRCECEEAVIKAVARSIGCCALRACPTSRPVWFRSCRASRERERPLLQSLVSVFLTDPFPSWTSAKAAAAPKS